MRHRTGIFAVVLVTATLCALAVGFGASAADAPGVVPQGRAAGFALQRAGQPSEIVGAALFLMSDASSFTTGSILRTDGGFP